MSNENGAGAAPAWVACGCAVAGWVFLTRRVRALQRRVDGIARKAELSRRDADRRLQALETQAAASAAEKAAHEVADLQRARHTVQQMIQQAERARRAYADDTPASQ